MGLGYQGYCKLDTSLVLTTSSSVNLVLAPIYSNSVWGAGWYNAAQTAHYADGGLHYEGSISTELQASSTVWNLMRDWIVEQRAYSKSFELSPDGIKKFNYTATPGVFNNAGAWCGGAQFSTSEGSFVTADLDVMALTRTTAAAGGTDYITNRLGVIAVTCANINNPLNPDGNNVDPIPFWRTKANLYEYGGTEWDSDCEAVEWNISVQNNPMIIYTCNGARTPKALLMGPIDATGSVVLFNQAGVFDPIAGPAGTGTETAPALYAENTEFKVEITRNAGSGPSVYLKLPATVIESDAYDIGGLDQHTNRQFSLKGLGGRCDGGNTMPPFVMTLAS